MIWYSLVLGSITVSVAGCGEGRVVDLVDVSQDTGELDLASGSHYDTVADSSEDTLRDVASLDTDPFDGWPWLPTARECWRYDPAPQDGVELFVNSSLATDGQRVFVLTTSGNPTVTFLETIDRDGMALDRAEVWEMNWPLPPMIDDAGNVLLVGQAISDSGQFRGVRVQKFSSELVEVWSALGDATVSDPVYGITRQLAMSAGAVDGSGNVYAVVGSFLKSWAAEDGALRWQTNVAPSENGSLIGQTAPTLVDDHVYIFRNDGTLMVISVEGEQVLERSLFRDQPTSWMSASSFGLLSVGVAPDGLAILSLQGDLVGYWDNRLDPSLMASQPSFDGGVIVQAARSLSLYSVDSNARVVWQSSFLDTGMVHGMILDSNYRIGYLTTLAHEGLVILDGTSGEILEQTHPTVIPRRTAPVMLESGKLILVGHHPSDGKVHVRCIEVPRLGMPLPQEWSTPHANFRNQRRINSRSIK